VLMVTLEHQFPRRLLVLHSLTSQCRDECQHTVRQCQATDWFGLRWAIL